MIGAVVIVAETELQIRISSESCLCYHLPVRHYQVAQSQFSNCRMGIINTDVFDMIYFHFVGTLEVLVLRGHRT